MESWRLDWTSFQVVNKLRWHIRQKFDIKKIEGTVFLYRPSNKQLDFEIPISLSNYNLLIPDKRMLDGRWNIKVDWTYNNNSYLYKTDITY